ncbi:MAG: phospholipase D-like domain-containing protein [Candidatus Bathyarchaeia archaeon]
MVIEALCDRQIRDVVGRLLAYQRDAPIHVRIVSPIIRDVKLSDGEMLSKKINKLIKFKDAKVTLVINPKMLNKKDKNVIELLERLEEMGVRVHCKRNLHAKTILLESRKDKGVLIASANLTPSGLGSNKELGVYFLNELDDVYNKIYDYVTDMLKETNVSAKGGDFRANMV